MALTVEEKANLAAYLATTKDCSTLEQQAAKREELGVKLSFNEVADIVGCHSTRQHYQDGGEHHAYFSIAKYLSINLVVALVGFSIAFALAFWGPPIASRYWRWLHR